MIKYKYFFGSDKRSVPYLEVLIHSFDNLKVVTVEPKQTGRGRKLKLNPVEQFAVDNNIPCIYYSENQIFEDMEIGIVVSFQKIFYKHRPCACIAIGLILCCSSSPRSI